MYSYISRRIHSTYKDVFSVSLRERLIKTNNHYDRPVDAIYTVILRRVFTQFKCDVCAMYDEKKLFTYASEKLCSEG